MLIIGLIKNTTEDVTYLATGLPWNTIICSKYYFTHINIVYEYVSGVVQLSIIYPLVWGSQRYPLSPFLFVFLVE